MKLFYYFKLVKKIITEGINYTRNSSFPAGHYYSPILNIKEYEQHLSKKKSKDTLKDINLNEENQKNLLSKIVTNTSSIHNWDSDKSLRYQYNNKWFPYTDGFFLYLMLNHFKPNKIIEVGSGYSSAVMLDTNERDFDNKIQLTFIEPNPERLNDRLTAKDKSLVKIIKDNVQNVNIDLFEELKANDFLFIDSSHVAKTASDVNYLLFNVLPILNVDTIIHFHDIFFPFEYPHEWITGGRNWNEAYLLRAFLQNNTDYEILFFVDYFQKEQAQLLLNINGMKTLKNGSGIYIKKIR